VFGKKFVLIVRKKRGADVGSDHHLVMAKIKLKIASNRNKKMDMKSKRINVQKSNIPEIKEQFRLEIRNRFSILEAVTGMGNINQKWTQVKDVLIETTEKSLGFKERNRKASITEDMRKMIQERKQQEN
jgi:hypothetical protein